MGLLQIQLRDYSGYQETRRQMLVAKALPQHWLTYAMACYMNKDYEQAISVIDTFLKCQEQARDKDKLKSFELSELILFKSHAYETKGDIKGAVKIMIDERKKIRDRLAMNQSLARMYMILGEKEKAVEAVQFLI